MELDETKTGSRFQLSERVRKKKCRKFQKWAPQDKAIRNKKKWILELFWIGF